MFRYERRHEKLASGTVFFGRLLYSLFMGSVFVGVSLIGGIAGYMYFAHMQPIDAFLNAAMILGGMGPVSPLDTDQAKLFAGIYALYAGLLLVAVSGIVLAPVFHRVLHALHADSQD
jgi:hypothetical protein